MRDGFGPIPLFSGVLYCLVQSAAAEELLFRGLIGRRLIRWLGFARGNLLQALVFWSMHLLIFRWVFGTWISWIQLYAFVASFGLGWLGGYLNERGDGRSIAPSWMLHGLSNLATFLALAALRG